jgi:hypothetical protein
MMLMTEENNSCIPMNDAVSSVITAPWNMADAMNLLDHTLLLPTIIGSPLTDAFTKIYWTGSPDNVFSQNGFYKVKARA